MNQGGFKAAANEIGNWVWGAAQGGFNEKQTIGQIMADAGISMFPIAGEITAARDVIAASLRLAEYPEKREETMEWIALVLPLLAIVPVLGGALKGIGKLIMRAGKTVEEDREILNACIMLLNKVGEGDAVQFFKKLDFTTYAAPIRQHANEVLTRITRGVDEASNKYGALLPGSVISHMEGIKMGVTDVRRFIDRKIPQALKDLNNRLKYIQKLAYEGDWHLIPGAGKAITREAEARLVHDALLGKEVWTLENAKFPQNPKEVFVPKDKWPDLEEENEVINLTDKSERTVHHVIAAFHGPIKAKRLGPGTVIYRVIEPKGRAEGAWWSAVDPKTITGWYWRVKFAVCDSWSVNGKYVKYTVKDKPLHAWEGTVSSQIDQSKVRYDGSANAGYGQYLEGGETQLYIDFKHESNAHAREAVSKLTKENTHWVDHMNMNIPERGASVQKLGKYVEEQKSLASANLATAANQAGRAVRAANNNDKGN